MAEKKVIFELSKKEARHMLEVLHWKANEVVTPDHGMTTKLYYSLKNAMNEAR